MVAVYSTLAIAILVILLASAQVKHSALRARTAKLEEQMNSVRRLLSEMYLTNDDRIAVGLPPLQSSLSEQRPLSLLDHSGATEWLERVQRIDLTELEVRVNRLEQRAPDGAQTAPAEQKHPGEIPACDKHEWSSMFVDRVRFERNEAYWVDEYEETGYVRRCLVCSHRQVRDNDSRKGGPVDAQSSYKWYDD